MKIQLERNLRAYPHRLRCIACEHPFAGGRARILLRHQSGSFAGDVCTGCLQLGISHIQGQLKARAVALFKQPLSDGSSPSPHKKALELWELATSPLVMPPFYYWWWQRLTIFAAETQDLKLVRRTLRDLRSHKSTLPTITFLTEEPHIGKDN
ncbi:hypothetical protein [Chamaesiphon sp.]|uniref:hypothetical protein n=1 Tax=Chamaesiphon sp. TaxID=2814140 RepID=UPI00359483CB